VLLESHRPPSWAFVVPPFEFSTCIYHKRQRFEVALTWLGILKGMTFSVPAGLGSIAGGPEAAARAPSAQAKGGRQNQGKRLYKPHALSLGGEAESWRMSLAPSSQLQWILNPLGHSFKGPPPPPARPVECWPETRLISHQSTVAHLDGHVCREDTRHVGRSSGKPGWPSSATYPLSGLSPSLPSSL